MPNLVPIKKESNDEEVVCCGDDDLPRYPWGTELDLRDDLVDALSIGDLEVGSEVTIISTGFIAARNERGSERLGEQPTDSKTVSIQLTAIQVEPAVSDGQSAEKILNILYPSGE